MTKDEMRKERIELQALLDNLESGKLTHYSEDDRGELNRDTTADRCDRLKRRIAELDRKMTEDWRDA